MVSDELRNFKPYAIPFRVLKYTSLTDKNARDLKDELKSTMEDMGMVTVGMFKLYNYFIIFNSRLAFLHAKLQIQNEPIFSATVSHFLELGNEFNS